MRRSVPVYARPGPSRSQGQPPIMSELNITPLIDVMLVLLVMFIITLPAMTHKVPIELPQPGPDRTLPQVMHRLVMARSGALSLDGRPIGEAELPARLAALRADRQAVLTLRTDPEARYERFAALIATVKRAGVTRLGFEGNEAMRF